MRLPAPFDVVPTTALRRIELSARSALFHQGDPTRGSFFLEAGILDMRRVTENGDVVVLHRAHAGSTFAEASLFASHYHCDAIAVSASRVVELGRSQILDLFERDSTFAKTLAERFAEQVQSYRRRLELLAIRSAEERVYAAISSGMLTGSIKSLTDEIGLTHEAVYRALAKLVNDNRIQKTARGQYRRP